MAEHAWVQANLDSYLAGELTTGERDGVEQHVAGCEACTLALAETRRLEQVMHALFADARPDANLDERVIRELQQVPLHSFKRPMIWRMVAAAAAVLVIGLIGGVVQGLMSEESPLFVKDEAGGKAAKDRAYFGAILSQANAVDATTLVAKLEKEMKGKDGAPESVDKLKLLMDGLKNEGQQKQQADAALNTNTSFSVVDGDKKLPTIDLALPPDGGKVAGGVNERDANKKDAGGEVAEKLKAKVQLDTDDAKKTKERYERFFDQADLAKANLGGDKREGFYRDTNEDAMKLTKKLEAGYTKDLDKVVRKMGTRDDFKPGDAKVAKEVKEKLDKMLEPPPGALPTANLGLLFKNPLSLPMPPGYGPGATTTSGSTNSAGRPTTAPADAKMTKDATKTYLFPMLPSSAPPPSIFERPPLINPPGSDAKGQKKGDFDMKEPPSKKELPYFKGEEKLKDKSNKEVGDENPDGTRPGQGKQPVTESPKKVPDSGKKAPKPPADEPPLETNRKIIRTGEMEFEIDSFDKSVDTITKIITVVKGGFIATINSDKLANGKMRGNVVVRMPPQFLDKFVMDLRRELAKTGELKNQRIVSLDVTKQYTDIESRLRAARTMEERLIQIIKIGKGEIKDLVAAEKELGVWRTKIEEMEGEIRYYANQVALSTLTINLTEKEILAPTAIVVTESVRMRLEVDDVAKAHQAAMAYVEEVKGRITRSELKQHSAGQLESILQADIPPGKKDEFRDKLKKLGLVADHEENQSQHTEGGVGRGAELKPRKSDVRFDISMHNTANVRPRLTADLKIATADVPVAYAKLLDAIAKAKGQVRDGKLNELDKLNITAMIDFNVPIGQKPAIDKVLFDIGPILERVNVLAPVNELSTERKFGYTLLLRDFASIPPSKAVVEIIAVTDVPTVYGKLQDAIAKAKGQVADAKLNELDKLNVNATLEFSIPIEEKTLFDKLLKDLGAGLSRTNVQAPLKQLTTARKFGYTLVLRDFISIPPSKAVVETIAVIDVPGAYAKIQEAIVKSKGHVADAKLNELDKFNINASIEFSVMSEEKENFDALLKDLGSVLSLTRVTAPINQISTARKVGYSILVRDFVSIPASKSVTEIIAVTDVPAAYDKLTGALAKAKAHIADARLNEQDKLNVNAQVDFAVMVEDKPVVDALLKDLGFELVKTNVQMPLNLLSTPRKFGYALLLKDYKSVPPSKATDLKIAVNDVPATYAKLGEAIAKAEGHVVDAKLNEADKLHITGQLTFSVPAEKKAEFDRLLDEIGTLLSRNNKQAPVNHLSTAKKFGYELDLRDFAQIPPTQLSAVTIAAANVPGNYAKIIEAIGKAKGQVANAKLNEEDKLNVNGEIDFNVPSAQKSAIDKLLADMGTVLSRKNVQAPVTTLSTDSKFGYVVTVRDFASIEARETFTIQLAIHEVRGAYDEFQTAVAQAKGWIKFAKDSTNEAQIDFDVPAAGRAAIEKLIAKAGAVASRNSSQVPVDKMATNQKVGYKLKLTSTASIGPRDTTLIKFEVSNVDEEGAKLKSFVLAAKGRVVDSTVDRHESGQVVSAIVFEVPFKSQDSVLQQMKTAEPKLLFQRSTRDIKVIENDLTTARIIVTLSADPIVPSDKGIESYVRTSLNVSFKILAVIVMSIIVGLSGIVPIVLLVWIGFKMYTLVAGAGHGHVTLASATTAGSTNLPAENKPAEGEQPPVG